jgi:hypothetical protein
LHSEFENRAAGAAAKMVSRDEARLIAVNIANLAELLGAPADLGTEPE